MEQEDFVLICIRQYDSMRKETQVAAPEWILLQYPPYQRRVIQTENQ